jgi:HSP20 family protein
MNAMTLYRPISIESALDDFDRLMGSFFGESPLAPARASYSRVPAVDVRETENGYTVEAELPGLDEKNVEVHVEGRNLTIESKEEEKTEKEEARYVIRERRSTTFRRSFSLPDDADPATIAAKFKNGVLELDIKKREEAKRRLVKIESK